MTAVTKILKGTIYLSAALYLGNCAPREKNDQWAVAEINAAMSKDSIYKQLDSQQEIFSVLEKEDSLMKRTSNVAYFSGQKINLTDDRYSKLNNCRAYFFHSDTIAISIGIGNGFGGRGFVIKYKGNQFYTEPYLVTDVVMEGQTRPTYKIVYQKLTLDKSTYSIGDSLYGKIDFKSIETNPEKDTIEYFGKGYFRAKVTRL